MASKRSAAAVQPIEVEPKDGIFFCPIDDCTSKFSTINSLRNHCRVYHEGTKVTGKEVKFDWNCLNVKPTGGRQTRNQSKDYFCLNVVGNSKGYKCPLCREPAASLGALQLHCEVHQVRVVEVEKLAQKDYSARRTVKLKKQREFKKKELKREPFDFKAARKYGNHATTKTGDQLVEVRESTIPGAGLGIFACKDLIPSDVVTKYAGKWYKNSHKSKLSALENSYSIDLDNGVLVGISEPQVGKGLASFVNRGDRDKKIWNNCMLLGGPGKKEVFLHVKNSVKAGQELFSPYGSNCKLCNMTRSDH